ncbi:MAG: hypothetical protein NT157_03405 [Candidatus Micrarchaeota archaeon]|nr:hypothetical protein [Candidatus Micrarchaeota archaeon]
MWGANLFGVQGNLALAGLLAAVFAIALLLAEAGVRMGLAEVHAIGGVALASAVSLVFYYITDATVLGTAVFPAAFMGAMPFAFYYAQAWASRGG